jgi:putative sigma-54 modulation protein
MKLQMYSIHFDADQSLLDFIQAKLNKLDTFYDRIVDGEVFLRLDNNNGITNKIVEVKLFVPGSTLFTKTESTTFENATDEALATLTRQIKKYKEKITAH